MTTTDRLTIFVSFCWAAWTLATSFRTNRGAR